MSCKLVKTLERVEQDGKFGSPFHSSISFYFRLRFAMFAIELNLNSLIPLQISIKLRTLFGGKKCGPKFSG